MLRPDSTTMLMQIREPPPRPASVRPDRGPPPRNPAGASVKQPAVLWNLCFCWSWIISGMLCLLVVGGNVGYCDAAAAAGSSSIVATFGPDDRGLTYARLTHLQVHRTNGKVYVGGVNRIYQLDSDLKLEETVVSGPVIESPACPVNADCSNQDRRQVNNENRILLIYYDKNRLVACGTVAQGACQIRDLLNITLLRQADGKIESVAASDPSLSVVAFIGPGSPPINSAMSKVMYVGRTVLNQVDDSMPSVSTRSLDETRNPFEIAFTDALRSTGTFLTLEAKNRLSYRINYIFGFSSGRFSYFVTVQPRSLEFFEPYRTKIVRICHDDANYYSYTEVALSCIGPDTTYDLAQAAYVANPGTELADDLGIRVTDDVLFVAFSNHGDVDQTQNRPGRKAALCMYSIQQIQQKFTENIRQCFTGNGVAGLGFVRATYACQKSQIDINDEFCGIDFNYPYNGSLPLLASPILTLTDTRVTSVAVSVTHAYTVAFLGTEQGTLKKVVVESKQTAKEYSEIAVDPAHPLLADMSFSPTKDFIYAATSSKVSKIRVQDCSVYTSCSDCLGASDPHCGFCTLENKCSLRSDCSMVKGDQRITNWIPYKSQKCTRIASVTPSQIQRTTARTLALAIENLPSIQGNYACVFGFPGSAPLETNATRSADGVTCATPRVELLPEIPGNDQSIPARLSVRMVNGGPEFSAANVTFYDCAALTDCGSCVSSPYPCDWCVQGHRCTHDTGENCRNDYLVNGQNRSGYSSRSGPSFCPRIRPATGFQNDQYTLVPSGMLRQVAVRVENIQPFQSRFSCAFSVDGRLERAEANLVGDLVTCSPVQFGYQALAPNATAALYVTWSDDKPLDNPGQLYVMIYKCAAMSSNCGFCLDLPPEFECGWCEKTCQVRNQCQSNERVTWLDRSSTCPNPEILRISPATGPWEGGTQISIEGINLGKTFTDISGGVVVAGHPCMALPDRYERTSKIVCQTEQIRKDRPEGIDLTGEISVNVANQFKAVSPMKFSYVDPKILKIWPTFGPKSGGTRVIIQGRYLDAGSRVTANIGQPCEIVFRNGTIIVCITSPATASEKVTVEMMFDNGRRTIDEANGQQFEYLHDPDVSAVDSFGSGQLMQGARGTPSGGSFIYVDGTLLNTVADPQMVFVYNGREYAGDCDALSDIRMQCRSPAAKVASAAFPDGRGVDRPVELEWGFRMDGVGSLKNLSRMPRFKKFELFPDPIIYNFSDPSGVKYHKSEYLFIDGENLNHAYRMEDYTVEIGMGVCNITSLSRKQLTCRPPDSEPIAKGADGRPRMGSIPEVRVSITDRLNVSIGSLSYDSPIAPFVFSTEIIVGIAVGAGILVLVLIAFFIAYRRKATESNRVLKTMQEQIDVLELQVASECKEAFAELQTDITDWTEALNTGGIPFRDYRWYVAKVLFPNSESHPTMTGEMTVDPARKHNIENGLKLFQQLLLNKTFLLTFIRTLESNRYFGMRDRVNVASLLMAVLQSDMVYCTDILKTLLTELIEKAVDSKSNPNLKLLMRRNESVAEKMLSAWLTFLLYPFLKEVAGRPLYLLYRAVQMQIEMGPVDSLTSEAKYSLSEEKLIRQKIDYKKMLIYVSCVDPEHNTQEYPVKVLDCDSITQIKEKALDVIYRNTAFSRRPRPDNLDLEWRTGQAGRTPLQDEDQTSVTESGGGGVTWRRLNTLQHYHVNDGAAFVLLPKHTNFYNLTIMSDKSDKSLQSHKSSPGISRGASPFVRGDADAEHGIKSWHLVRPHDSADPPSRDGTTKRNNKLVTEIYLTRLLTTKTTLKKFIDEMFETILRTNFGNYAFPQAIKYLFDFLDDQALHHEIQDPEVVHTWKSNSLPLRFWVNLIKNPNFVFNIHKSNSVDSCLSVIAQALMESCSTTDLKLSKDSPSSKLLFAKDITGYQQWVRQYYDDIKYHLPEVTELDFNHILVEESKAHKHDFHTRPALLELFTYAKKHIDPLMAALNADEFSERARLPSRVLQVVHLMNAEIRP
ncbi:Plexin-A1 [Hypsibius exemplaris]|uniref:Plexin-A1 n=1 Tax=Hypsibius exemplaris TaxID=2072580 RepID=A0A1W0X9H4_HYPEX|nr:Plexin-A1 [Hypsibius exemplaris]